MYKPQIINYQVQKVKYTEHRIQSARIKNYSQKKLDFANTEKSLQ